MRCFRGRWQSALRGGLNWGLQAIAVGAICLGLGGLALADTPRTGEKVPALDPSFQSTGEHRVILIMEDGVDPKTLELEQGQLVVWISYSRDPSVVVFDREVARHMVCHSLVNFALRDGELRSDPIDPGEFASFCELKPGKYDYRVTRVVDSASKDEGGSARTGTLEVRASE